MLVHNKGKYVRHAAGATLLPGVNDVKESDYKRFSSHPIAKKWIEKGEIKTFEKEETDGEDTTVQSTKDLNAEGAIDLVEDTFTVSMLEDWEEKEDRKTVLEAIDKQLAELEGKEDENTDGEA
ncbi:hypothetical protein J2S78_002064 [Salibacterium salarium]|uniref:hypothetical protein n=1 Tax=Salibacterium salarium TaxID=284579 RepID=UPI0027850BDB|nr:hypothetical protein [Salibacterium salarium]MDQ0299644.1 hypothetical protein [Salibacterium salarium]